jgi:large subunit ribosomal protein L25
MEAITLQAKKRSVVGKQTKQLRAKGVLPAVVYGHGIESRNIELDTKTFDKAFRKAGESSLLDLEIDGAKPIKVLIQDVTRSPLQGLLMHADFREVNMTEKLDAEVVLKLVGEAPAVKELGGILVRSMDKIHVRCLPGDLVHEIEVDITKLKKFDDAIKVKDITPPKGMEFKANPNEVIVVINEPISEEELTASLDSKPVEDVSAVKVETDEKKAAKAAEEADAAPKEDKK